MSHDSLGDRMKTYEGVTRTHLTKRTPVIIRLDGKAFHTYTKHIVKQDPSVETTPWSDILHDLMEYTTNYLISNIQGCTIAYTQSDEISLLLKDWDTLETSAWFDNNILKMCSTSAAMATMAFNSRVDYWRNQGYTINNNALFDSRVFNLPPSEVCNYFLWRQQDASRNSVQMLGHYHFSHKELQGLSNVKVQDLLMLDKGVNWNDLDTWKKRGTCIYRELTSDVDEGEKRALVVDKEIPIFSQSREYINKHLE